SLCFLSVAPPPPPTLFPYTTLFRSPPVAKPRRTPVTMIAIAATLAIILGTVLMFRQTTSLQQPITPVRGQMAMSRASVIAPMQRSEEHTSELQSRGHLVCRLLLDKK